MPAKDPDHKRAAARVAILARWRLPDDPELLQARRALAVARTQVRLTEAVRAYADAEREFAELAVEP